MSGMRPTARSLAGAAPQRGFPHVLLALDASNLVSSASGHVEDLLGYRCEDLVGVSAETLFADSRVAPVWCVSSQVCRTKSGATWSTYRRSAPIYAADGASMGSMELLSDALHTSAPSVQRTHNLEVLGRLASGIAHDFNNLLQAIEGHATLAREVIPADAPVHENLEQVLKASARGAELVRRILAFSRLEQTERGVIDLCAVAREAVELLRPTLPSSVRLRAVFAQERMPVLASATELHQVIVNIATNAVQAMRGRAGVIELGVAPLPSDGDAEAAIATGPHALLTVRDDGAGMSEEVRARIFEPFFTTRATSGGTGLGLSMVHSIVASLGGAIEVDSAPERGSTFRVYLPRAAEQASTRALELRDFPVGQGERLLYVDDDPVLITLGKSLLEAIGYRVTACEGPQAALAAFHARPHEFELVLSDVSMPVLSGFELARRVRQVRPELPVLMMSGYVGPEEQALAREVGAREILLKPVGMADFGRALARQLRPA